MKSFLFGDTLQNFDQQIGGDLDVLNLADLVGRMHIHQRRPNGDHIQMRVLLRESTALHTGVHRLHDHIRAGQVLVGITSDMGQLAVGIDRSPRNMAFAVEGKPEVVSQRAADHTNLSSMTGNTAVGKHREAHH